MFEFVQGSEEQQPTKYGSSGQTYHVPPRGQVKWQFWEADVQSVSVSDILIVVVAFVVLLSVIVDYCRLWSGWCMRYIMRP